MRDWLKKARTDRSLTMGEMADKLGISTSYYCYIEHDERQKKMDLSIMRGLSDALNIPLTKVIRKETEYAETK